MLNGERLYTLSYQRKNKHRRLAISAELGNIAY